MARIYVWHTDDDPDTEHRSRMEGGVFIPPVRTADPYVKVIGEWVEADK